MPPHKRNWVFVSILVQIMMFLIREADWKTFLSMLKIFLPSRKVQLIKFEFSYLEDKMWSTVSEQEARSTKRSVSTVFTVETFSHQQSAVFDASDYQDLICSYQSATNSMILNLCMDRSCLDRSVIIITDLNWFQFESLHYGEKVLKWVTFLIFFFSPTLTVFVCLFIIAISDVLSSDNSYCLSQ